MPVRTVSRTGYPRRIFFRAFADVATSLVSTATCVAHREADCTAESTQKWDPGR